MVFEEIENNHFSIYRCTRPKFMKDKLFCEDDSVITVLEGIILNSSDLFHETSLFEYVKKGILNGQRFYENFRGNFSGAVYDKSKSEWEFFTDCLGMKPVFYYCSNGVWAVSSDVIEIINMLKDQHFPYTLNVEAAYDLLTYGFMIGDNTLVREIKKLPYGSYMKFLDGEMEVYRYYDFDYCQNQSGDVITDDEIIEKMDSLFRQAVKLQFQKDDEYGYEHLATLSGGLDSRMTVWVAHSLGYGDMTNLTFGESDCADEKISKLVAKKLGHSMIVRTLDDGRMLTQYKDVVRLNGGISLYSGIAHSFIALSSINVQKYGILHTGDLGDAIVGPFAYSNEGDYPGAYSLKLKDNVTHKWDKSLNIEKFKMITRGFNGVGASKIVSENFIDCLSPFLYKDFFEFCLGEIPFEKRDHHYMYKKWVMTKYPDAAQLPLQRYNGGLMNEGIIKQTFRKVKRIGIKTVFEWILWKIGVKHELSRRIVKSSMNPMDLWYEEKKSIANDMNAYTSRICTEAIKNPEIDKQLIACSEKLYREGNTSEKTQVITLLSFIEDWFLST